MRHIDLDQAKQEEDRRQKSLSKRMIFAGWALAFLVATLFVDSVVLDEEQSPRVSQTSDADWPVILSASRSGLYFAHGRVDGVQVDYVVDTGAVIVAVSLDVANAAGMQKGGEIEVSTANGKAVGWLSKIERLDIGSLSVHDVDAVILDNLAGAEVLLGMSALRGLEIVQTQGTLRMRPAP